jgi:hypothetical protein
MMARSVASMLDAAHGVSIDRHNSRIQDGALGRRLCWHRRGFAI